VDFGYLGMLDDPVTGRRRKAHALIFTACYSRHMYWAPVVLCAAGGPAHSLPPFIWLPVIWAAGP
jgi:hypothetical protein